MSESHDRAMFHDVLRSCMNDSRPPNQRELDKVAAKIWQDSYRTSTGLEWADVKTVSAFERQVLAAARAAVDGIRPRRSRT